MPYSAAPPSAVTYGAPTATDTCSAVTYSYVPASVSPMGGSSTIVTCKATDACGNYRTCTFTVSRAALGFNGFLPPIGGADATGASFADPLRAFKSHTATRRGELGSTIPVKFAASCGGSAVLTGIHTLQAVKYSNAADSDPAIDATPTLDTRQQASLASQRLERIAFAARQGPRRETSSA